MRKATDKHVLTSLELSGFCAQIAMMMSAGLPLYDGLEAMADTHKDSANAGIYRKISTSVIESGSLYAALKEEPAFPPYLTEMAGIGERSGHLEQVMNGLSAYYARDSRIRSAVRSAVTYPLMLGVMMALIVLIIVWKALPVFNRVLSNMGIVPDASASAMMNLGVTIGWIILVLTLLVACAAIVFFVLLRTSKREEALAFLFRAFRPAAKIRRDLSASRVSSVLSMMLGSGFPMEEALEMLPGVLHDPGAEQEIKGVRDRLNSGTPFGDALTAGGLFDELHSSMIRTGCNVSCADQVMARVASDCEERVEDEIAGLVSVIEPTMVAVLAVVVGCVLLSVMLPMAGLISGLV